MLNQVVLLRLAEQFTLAAVSVEHSPDEADLRAFARYADGHLGVVEISNARRGTGVGEWQPAPWPIPEPVVLPPAPPPQLATVQAELMPVAALPAMPPLPLLVIIRY